MGQKSTKFCLRPRRIVFALILIDTLMLLLSVFASLFLRFDGLSWSTISRDYVYSHLASLPFIILFYLLAMNYFRLYNCAWRFASLDILWNVIKANTVGLSGLVIVQSLMDGVIFPRSVLAITLITNIMLTGGVRILLRVLSILRAHGWSIRNIHRIMSLKRVVILGADADGVRVLRAINEEPQFR